MTIKAYRHTGDAIKALDEYRVGGYLVRFTNADDTDLYGEYFDKDTDFWLERGYPVKGSRVLLEHGLDDFAKVMPIGLIDLMQEDEIGLYVEARLHDRAAYENMLKEMRNRKALDLSDTEIRRKAELAYKAIRAIVETGKVQWSSGALPQSVVVEDKHIKSWAIIEGSLTFTPAESEGTEIAPIKSALEQLQDFLSTPPANAAKEATPIEPTADKQSKQDTVKTLKQGLKNMDILKQIMALIQQLLGEMGGGEMEVETEGMASAVMDEVKADIPPEEELMKMTPEEMQKSFAILADKVAERVKAAVAKKKSASDMLNNAFGKHIETAQRSAPSYDPYPSGGSRQGNPAPKRPQVSVSENLKYAHLTAQDMAAGYLLLESTLPKAMRGKVAANTLVSEEYARHMARKAAMEMEKSNPKRTIEDVVAMKSSMPYRADEIDATDIAGQGTEWVGTFYGTTLWEKARNAKLFDELQRRGLFQQEIPQGASSVVIPTEGSDPVAYSTPQANDLDATNRVEVTAKVNAFGTGSKTLTAAQIKIAAAATDELVEDSVIPILAQMNRQIEIKAMETLDQAILNGDTATGANTNINLIDGTPATGISRPYYLAVNGLRKYPLVTNTAYARSAGGSLALDDFRLTLALFAPEVQVQLDKLLFIMDVYTHNTALGLPEIATDDVRRTNATITSGRILNIFGVDVLTSGFLVKNNSAGKTPAAGGTLGQLLAVYAPYWAFGWKRNVRLDTQMDILSGVTYAVASMRFGLVTRGADSSAETYNIGLS